MRKATIAAAFVLICGLAAFAQDGYKAEVFGGYQFTRVNPGDGLSGVNFNGWNASVTGNVKSWLGVTADFSGGYKSVSGASAHVHNFLFGPTLSYNKLDHFKPFVHTLFGVSHASGAIDTVGSASDNAFAMALGGGVDAGITRHIALRLVQADYLMTRFQSTNQNNARISTGVVFRF